MTDQATRVVQAGWYQDPAQAEQVRWWNGVAWTEHVREKPRQSQAVSASGIAAEDAAHGMTVRTTATDAGTASAAAVAAESTEQRIAAARELERQFGISTSENAIITAQAAAGAAGIAQTFPARASLEPARSSAPATGSTAARASSRTSTGSSWLIALSPLLLLALGIVAAYIYFYVLPTLVVFPVAFAVPYLLCVLWALGDRRALAARGFKPPSPLWALATALVYLIVRRVRVSGAGPLAMFLVVGLLVVGTPPLLAVTGQLTPLSAALRIQQTIANDYVSHGKAILVNCPPFVDATKPGTLYTCDITQATGVHKTLWVSIDGDGTFSYAISL